MKGEKLWEQFLELDENGKPVSEKSSIAGISRRSFLAALGYTAAGVTLLSCRVPEQKIIPNLKQAPEEKPGIANWYASTCSGCSAGCGTLVKVRDGRPIKVEGNPEHPISKGGLCSVAHSLVFSLYDSERIQKPLAAGKEVAWKDIDVQMTEKLSAVKQTGGKVRFLSQTVISPTSKATIDKFLTGFKDGKHIVYESASTSAVALAHTRTHGAGATPVFHFDRAKVVVGFDADFLGTWISPVQFTKDYSTARDLKKGQKEMSRHIQFESRMSLTGANADKRIKLSSAEEAEALLFLSKTLVEKGNQPNPATVKLTTLETPALSPQMRKNIETTADELLAHKGESLVVSGSNDADIQQIVNVINQSLGNYGKTIDIEISTRTPQSGDQEFVSLLDEMKKGEVAALFVLNANPAYDYFASADFSENLKKVPLKVSFSPTLDETASLADFNCPNHHSLEAWDDAETVRGTYSFNQPTIAPLFATRAYQESLMLWSGDNRSYYEALRANWQGTLFTKQTKQPKFDDFWDKTLQDGVFVADAAAGVASQAGFNAVGLDDAIGRVKSRQISGYSLALYQKISIRDGRYANSPWLQELPDPISKTTWDNYACVSPETAAKLNLSEGQIVSIKKENKAIELPVLIQQGQSDDCIAVALGYGRAKAGKAGNNIGANAFPFVEFVNGTFRYQAANVTIEPTGKTTTLAKTQTAESALGRPLVENITISQYVSGKHDIKHPEFEKLFAAHDYPVHKWGMAIDLSACTGCNACVLSCQAENNSPVVGKAEVAKTRDMQWLRIDRYYKDTPDGVQVDFQPLPCMQCENATCEMVCPVLATAHSSEGLNMQVYNRCVGTRYCANNCAYKVRHFNWFNYAHEDPIANLALNPDVTVRTRGVMEKCTFCVQRIEEKKIHARNEGRPIKDGEIQTACQQSCPANAIIFGDMTDLASMVNENKKNGRDYLLLEELNTKPAVSYLAKVSNREETKEEH
ncbi:MAG TPA: 4Fe-4S dicluster domain-containing protein [Pyrinomonadaceae bacterium]|nr:4Fe-4S dicluster domain-containing protein [Chloracidobacterium sp.]MBP9935941.1 4Fe-4S dicluster domain-containing protein [Pyrinomonadaceae bacterium]HQY67608.1 4Fe-4S dicluster domain-containing protein [Pyrinomonadaceae bacterium]